jgi:hypothetical protein
LPMLEDCGICHYWQGFLPLLMLGTIFYNGGTIPGIALGGSRCQLALARFWYSASAPPANSTQKV